MTGPIRNSTDERLTDSFVESPTRANKTAVEVVDSFFGPLDVPATTDFITGYNSGSNFIVEYKVGGLGGTVLKTLTFNKTGCPFQMVIS